MGRKSMAPRLCEVEGCENRHIAKGLCRNHYYRMKRYGSATASIKKLPSPDERFEAKVERVPFSDCEYWMGASNSSGYGHFWWGDKTAGAHRFQWERNNGPIPDGLHVLHTCHQGHVGCVAIHHLKLGTNADNVRDAIEAGRNAKGEAAGSSKLTECEVARIKRLLHRGRASASRISRLYGVKRTTIDAINQGRTWSHVDREILEGDQ